jgi:uncharacterized membrane protein
MGGLCGGEVAKRGNGVRTIGIVAGSLAAIAASYGGYALRADLTQRRKLPGFPTAAAEDGITLLLVRFAMHSS